MTNGTGSIERMDVEAPPIVLPQFDFQPPQPRNLVGWVFLSLLFALVILLQLAQYLMRDEDATKTFRETDIALKNALVLKESGVGGMVEDPLLSLQDEINRIRKYRAENMAAAKLTVAYEYERGQPIRPAELAIFKRAKKPADHAFYSIYSAQKLSPQQARSLAGSLSGSTSASLLAKIHAWEKAGDRSVRRILLPRSKTLAIVAIVVLGLCATCGGLILLGLYIVKRSQGEWQPLSHPAEPVTAWAADRFALRMAFWMLAFVVLPTILIVLMKGLLGLQLAETLASASTLLVLAGVIAMPLMGKRSSFKELIGDTSRPFQKAMIGVGAAFANIIPLALLGWLGIVLFRFLPEPSHPAVEELLNDTSLQSILTFFLLACVIAPIVEELTFRGMLLPALFRGLNSRWKAIVLTNLLFAAIHPTGIPAWLALAGLGVMSSLLTIQTRSLIPSIFMHATHNGSLLLLSLFLT